MIDKDTLWVARTPSKTDWGAEMMVRVGKCPQCGAPIYGPNEWIGATPPPISHTCECRNYRPLRDYLPHTSPIMEDDRGIPNYTKLPLATSP